LCPGCSPRTTRSRLSGNIKLDLDDPGGHVDTGPLLSGERLRLDDLGISRPNGTSAEVPA
jgi:hypothetical protein